MAPRMMAITTGTMITANTRLFNNSNMVFSRYCERLILPFQVRKTSPFVRYPLRPAPFGSQYSFCQDTVMQAEILLTLRLQQKLFADPRRIALLKQIEQTGSISQGAKNAGISYKSAWDAINEM